MMTLGGRWLQKGRAGSGATPAYDPAALFVGGQQGAWQDESTQSTMYQDSAATNPITAYEQLIGRMSDRSGRGNHGVQISNNNRTTYSSRVNNFTKTEQLADVAWTKSAAAITGGQPDQAGGNAAFLLTDNVSSAYHYVGQVLATGGVGQVGGISCTVKAATSKQWMVANLADSTDHITYFDLINGVVGTNAPGNTPTITALGNGWYTITITRLLNQTSINCIFASALLDNQGSYLGTGVACLYLFKPQSYMGSTTPRYQSVDTATSYDSVGFPAYMAIADTKWLLSDTGGGGTNGFFFCQAIKPATGGVLQAIWSDADWQLFTGYRIRITAANQVEFTGGLGAPIAAPNFTNLTTAATGGQYPPNTSFWYVIAAYNGAGQSVRSGEGQITTGVVVTNTHRLDLTWQAVAGATNYRVYRGQSGAGNEDVGFFVGNVTSFTDTGGSAFVAATPLGVDFYNKKLLAPTPLVIGATSLITVWDDGVNFNIQVNDGAVASTARGAVVAGTAGYSVATNNQVLGSYMLGNMYPSIYRQLNLTPTERTSVQSYCKSKAGL